MTPEIPGIWNKRHPASAGLKLDEVSQAPRQARGDDDVKAMLRKVQRPQCLHDRKHCFWT